MPDNTHYPAPILVSACLCGEPCRYDGRGAAYPVLTALREQGLAIPVCPEVLGGLPIPRDPCERNGERVMSKSGRDCTAEFTLGAQKTLDLARQIGATVAVLKERSPSCGSSTIYDGSFQGERIPGQGVTAALLAANGITVYSEETFPSRIGTPAGTGKLSQPARYTGESAPLTRNGR